LDALLTGLPKRRHSLTASAPRLQQPLSAVLLSLLCS